MGGREEGSVLLVSGAQVALAARTAHVLQSSQSLPLVFSVIVTLLQSQITIGALSLIS